MDDPSYFNRTKDELLISGTAVSELFNAIIERGKAFRFKARGRWRQAKPGALE